MGEVERRHLDRGPVIIKSMHGYPHHAYGRGIQYVEHAEGHGDKVFAAALILGLEGIVSKKLDAPYRSGPSRMWLKVKNPKTPAATRAMDGTF